MGHGLKAHFLEFLEPKIKHPDYDNYISNESTTKWTKLFQFTFHSAKLEDFKPQVRFLINYPFDERFHRIKSA